MCDSAAMLHFLVNVVKDPIWIWEVNLSFQIRHIWQHHCTHDPLTYDPRPCLIHLVKLGYSLNVHAWLPFWVAISIGIMENPNAPSKCWKEDCWLVITWLCLMWLLPRSYCMINHSLGTLVLGLWVWRWFDGKKYCFSYQNSGESY